MNNGPILKIEEVSLSFGGVQALKKVSMEVREDEIVAIIGPNGAGKTSLLNCISGFYRPQSGKIYFEGQDFSQLSTDMRAKLGVGRTFQNIELFLGLTVVDNLMAARHVKYRSNFLSNAVFFGPTQKEEIKHRKTVEEIIDFLKLEKVRKQVTANLSYGQKKRIELGRALAMEPGILLLDEPTAGMNTEEKEDMARFILDISDLNKIPIVLVEHDMGIVMDIADRIAVLDFGSKIAEGIPDEIKLNPKVIEAYLGNFEGRK